MCKAIDFLAISCFAYPGCSACNTQDNIPAKVIDGVYIGSIHAAFNQEAMHGRGITHVLNASGLPATFPRSFTYFTVDLRDKEETDILGALGAASVFIEAGIEKGGALVHCAGGRSRSAAFLAAFLMMKRDCTFDQAADLIRRARPVMAMNKVECMSRANYQSVIARSKLLR